MKYLSLMILLTACTSLPKGEHQLKKQIENDFPITEGKNVTYINKGRPIYIEANTYPQIQTGGHIYMGGKVYLFSGREELNLTDIIKLNKETMSENYVEFSKDIHQEQMLPSEIIKKEEIPPVVLPQIPIADVNKSEIVFPQTSVTQTLEDHLKLKQSSIKKSQMQVIDHHKCSKAKITQEGSCEELKVSFDLSKCIGETSLQEAHKVKCENGQGIFGVKRNNVRYRVSLKSMTSKDFKKVFWAISPKTDVMFIK